MTQSNLDKEYDIMNNKVKKVLDDAESKMIDLIETSDLVMKIDDLKDYVEDYSN